MHRIPCEADLSSEDDEVWAQAVSKCKLAATPQCIEAKACSFEGSCFELVEVKAGDNINSALEQLVIDLQNKVENLEVRQNTMLAALEYRFYSSERLYNLAVKKGNASNAFAYNILKSELKSIINDLNKVQDTSKLNRLKRNIHLLK